MIIGWDIETNNLNPYGKDSRILTSATVCDDGSSWRCLVESGAFMKDAAYRGYETIPLLPQSHPIFDQLEDPDNTVVGHNIIGFDVPYWEYRTKRPIKARLFDTQVAKALLDETGEGNSLDDLAREYLDRRKEDDGLNKARLAHEDPEKVLKYNLVDSELVLNLYKPLKEDLVSNNQWKLFRFLMEVGRDLATMMVTGAKVDLGFIETWSERLGQEATYLEADLQAALPEDFREEVLDACALGAWHGGTKELHLVGSSKQRAIPEINFNSPQQMVQLLYGNPGFNMPVKKWTRPGRGKKRSPATGRPAIVTLLAKGVVKHEGLADWLRAFLEFKKRDKLVGTYLRPLANEHLGTDGRVHTSYKLGKSLEHGGTKTGRLASSSPNLQNIPRDARVKGAFIPEPGWKMFEADYSQMELRVGAWYAQEESMLSAFERGEDIHTAYLAEAHGYPYERMVQLVDHDGVYPGDIKGSCLVDWAERRALIKPVQFGVFYGGGAFMLIEQAIAAGFKLTFPQAERMIEEWFSRRPRIRDWIQEQKTKIVANKEIWTPTGRVRHLPLAGWSKGPPQAALRQGVNFLVQSLASDFMLMAIREAAWVIRGTEAPMRLCLTVHDSLVGEYDPKKINRETVEELLTNTMVTRTAEQMKSLFGIEGIPLAVDVETNLDRWKEPK